MRCEFEEKQFEQHLNNQLVDDKRLIYAPGQVLENVLNFDAALFTTNPHFWRNFETPFWPLFHRHRKGIFLDQKWWKQLDESLEYFPPFKFNVFLQHKRAEYLGRSNAGEWEYWNKPYFRYVVDKDQQKALEKLESEVDTKGIVAYSSPAFHTLHGLWEAVRNNSMVKQTNFAQVIKLSRHNAYTFVAPGNQGKAFSEVEDIKSYNFDERLQMLSASQMSSDNNKSFITELGEIIHKIMMEQSEFEPLYSEIVKDLSMEIGSYVSAIALLRVSTFCFLTNTNWKIGI
jgi:hypothetical protein